MSETSVQNIAGKGRQNVANLANLQAKLEFIMHIQYMKNKRVTKVMTSRWTQNQGNYWPLLSDLSDKLPKFSRLQNQVFNYTKAIEGSPTGNEDLKFYPVISFQSVTVNSNPLEFQIINTWWKFFEVNPAMQK